MKDTIVFDNIQLTDILRDIHNNALEKRKTINGIIEQMTSLIKQPSDAVMLAPVIREFVDVGVKSDEQLVKVATIVQRMISAESYSSGGVGSDPSEFMSEEEKARLVENVLQGRAEVQEELTTAIQHIPYEKKL